jgi:hypothetical protein
MNAKHFGPSWLRGFVVVPILLIFSSLISCGGGGGSQTDTNPVSVSVTSQVTSINPGDSYTFTARVNNTTNTSVTWSVSCAQGVTDCGSIAASTGVYTAPGLVSTASNVTVKATSAADSSKSATTSFQLAATAVSITTHPSILNAGLNYHFSATITAANKSINWSLICAQDVSDCGSIASDGTYTSPTSLAQQTQVTVKATSVADATKLDTYIFALLPPIAVGLMPGTAEVVKGFPYTFAATTQNDMQNVGVTWAVNGVPGGNAQVGTITSIVDPHAVVNLKALYTPPATAPAGAITISATSAVDTNKSASANVTLIDNPHTNFVGDCAFVVSGRGFVGLDAAGGIVTLDGTGHLTAKVDIHSGSYSGMVLTGLDMTGTYGFEGRDGGWATLTYSQSGQSISMTFKFVFTSATAAKVMEFDGMGSLTGTIEKQDSTITTALDGKNVFTLRGYWPNNSNPSLSQEVLVVGQFTGATGHLSGVYDVLPSRQSYTTTANAWYQVVGKSGTVNLGVRDGTNLQDAPDLMLYPVSSDRSLVMSKVTATPDYSLVMVGSIDKQSDDVFSNTTLAGDWIFYYTNGVTNLQMATLGRFSSDGSGTSAPGCEDTTGGSFISPMCYGIDLNSYTITANGRGFAPAAQFATPNPVAFYFVDANHGYFGAQGGIGEFFRGEGGPFNNSSLNGAYTVAFTGTQDYFFNAKSNNQIGTATLDGNGNMTTVTSWIDARNFALLQGYTRTGTYVFDSDLYATGVRGTMSLGPDFQLLYYTVSPDKVLMIQIKYEDVSFGIMQRSAFSNLE